MKLCLREKVCMPQFLKGWHKLKNNLQFVARGCTCVDCWGLSVLVEVVFLYFPDSHSSWSAAVGWDFPITWSGFHSSRGCRTRGKTEIGREEGGKRKERVNICLNPRSLVVVGGLLDKQVKLHHHHPAYSPFSAQSLFLPSLGRLLSSLNS